MKRTQLTKKIISVCLCLPLLFCSCEKKQKSTYELVYDIKERFGLDISVSVYTSKVYEGEDGYFDPSLVGAMLGDGGEIPYEMLECSEFSFLCADGVSICEVWVAESHTSTGAREIFSVFEKRKKLLSMLEYENDSDREAADGAVVLRDGKRVYFAACKNSDEIVSYLCSSR